MSDLLLDLSNNAQARRVVKTLGLPIPMPQALRRARGPWTERVLNDRTVLVGGTGITSLLAQTLAESGANAHVVGSLAEFEKPGEAWARPATALELDSLDEKLRADAIVFDATSMQRPEELRALYDFFHPLMGTLNRCSRCIVIGRPIAEGDAPAMAATQSALGGFVRSLAKEVGKLGATAQLLLVEPGAEERLPPVLDFFFSERSAFVTGQPITIGAGVKPGGSYPKTKLLHGKVALVTGAARGIGAATAELLAAEGAHVVCLDRPADDGPLSQVARAIQGSILLCDISSDDAPQVIRDHLRERHGGVDIVVHNAGVTRDKTLKRMRPELWDQTIDINLTAVVRITEALLEGDDPVLRDHARVVCLSSVAGIAGNMGQTNYAASKAGVMGYVRQLAPTVAGRGITVNAIAPGFIETRLTAAMPAMIREGARRLSALGQGGQPEDVGQAIAFLSSPGSEGITGSVLRVCGGALVGA